MVKKMVDVTLVDLDDKVIGRTEKLDAHKNPKLHRAFSIFVFNDKNEVLLQQRAFEKYHCPGLWTNTCCSHPTPEEDFTEAAHRRLVEEMGFDTELEPLFKFTYYAEFLNGLAEYEIDQVFVGKYNGEVKFNPSEVNAVKWISLDELNKDVNYNPKKYTPWFKIILAHEKWKEYFNK